MQQYEEYKDSSAAWIGAIPSTWEVGRLKKHLKRIDARNPGNSQVLSLYRELGIIPKDSRNDNQNVTSEDTSKYKYVQPGDFVVNKMKAWQGSVAVSDYEGIVSPAYYVYKFLDNRFHKRYFHYLIRSCYKEEFMRLSAGIRIGQWDLSSEDLDCVPVLLPSMNEQISIAKFLDERIAHIDSVIAEAKASIEEYKAWKASIIYEAVTKGLDPNVEMKDSGIEWIGTMPTTWQLIRLKFLMESIVDCPHETPEYSNDGAYYVIRTADQDVGYLRPDENMYRLNENEYTKRIRRLPLNKGDIVYGREGERWGLACIVPENNKYCLGQRMMQFRCNSSLLLPEFARWALNSYGVYMQGTVDTIGSTSPHVNISTMRNYEIPVPTIEEQQKIATHVADKCNMIVDLIAEKNTLVAELEAYKKSLIFEVVTGKRKVV